MQTFSFSIPKLHFLHVNGKYPLGTLLNCVTKNFSLSLLKAWELLMTTALHENFTRQEIGLQSVNVNKSFKEERISLETQ